MGITKLESLKKKSEQLKAQIQKIEAAQSVKRRKQDTRRKILIGAYYWEKALKEDRVEDIKKLMEGFLTRNSDRMLFELEPIS